MLEKFGNIWDLAKDYDAIVITTNGYVKKDGSAVMGRGIAKEASWRYPDLPKRLGWNLGQEGNIPCAFTDYKPYIITFPVKPAFGPDGIPGWLVRADINLIKESAIKLIETVDWLELQKVILPRPGCGNGRLTWEQVKPIIEPILDDRFTVVTFHET